MLTVFHSLLPIIVVIVIGWASVRFGLIARESWLGVEHVSFRIFIPALIFEAIIHAQMSVVGLGIYVICVMLAVVCMTLLILMARRMIPLGVLGNPQMTTWLQLSIRCNVFISLALAAKLYGEGVVSLISLAMGFIILIVNLLIIPVMVVYGEAKTTPKQVALSLVKNPLIIASGLGLLFNLLEWHLPEFAEDGLGFVANGALGVGLLCVGASIDIRRLLRFSPFIAATVASRLVVSPLLFVLLAWAFGLGEDQLYAGVLLTCVAAASNGYIVAKSMGGDAESYAIGLTWQLVLNVIAIPIWLGILAALMG